MGIKNLTSFLKEYCPNSIETINLFDLNNKKAAIDISIFLYKFKYKTDLLIPKFIEQINRLRLNKIIPVYIFDGIPPKEKNDIINDRQEKKEFKKNKLCELKELLTNTINESEKQKIINLITKLDNKIINITKEDISNVKYMLELMNIKYLVAEGEADLLCSKLCQKGIVDFVISEDMDLLTSGTSLLVRDFNIYNNNATLYDLNKILKKLDISYDMWINMCILFGCDYLKRINGIGPKKSFKYIKQNLSIEEIINDLKNKNVEIQANYLDEFKKSKDIFLNPTDIELSNDFVKIEPLFGNQEENIKQFMFKNTGLTKIKIDNRIKNIYNNN